MTLEELAETCTVDLTSDKGPQYDAQGKIWDKRDVLKMCSSFVIESKGMAQDDTTLKHMLIRR